MAPMNNYVLVESVKQGVIAFSGENEYKVIDYPLEGGVLYETGDTVIVEPHYIVRVTVNGKERLYVKEENIIDVIKPEENN